MPFQEIPRRQWPHFLERFSEQHLGALCSLEVDSPVVGPELEACHSAFQGVVFEPGRHFAQLQVFVDGLPARHVSHAVSAPVGIWLERGADGSDRGLRVAAAEGSLLLRFERARPGFLV
jgi:hypothetical protein